MVHSKYGVAFLSGVKPESSFEEGILSVAAASLVACPRTIELGRISGTLWGEGLFCVGNTCI